jgi:hypothetical protein
MYNYENKEKVAVALLSNWCIRTRNGTAGIEGTNLHFDPEPNSFTPLVP